MNSIPTLTQVRGILRDPAPSWRWVVAMPVDVNAKLTSNFNISNISTSYNSGGLLTTPTVPVGRVQDIELPGITIDTDPRFGGATKTHYPRFLEVQNTPITFYEDQGYNSLKYLRAWRELVVDKNHNYYASKNYKKTIQFFAFGYRFNNIPSLVVEIKGAFPIDAGNGLRYAYTESGMVGLPCTFSVDYVELHWNPSFTSAASISV